MPAPLGVLPLRNPVRDYGWGSTTLIAQLRGQPESATPEAEVWIGAHPAAPSMVVLPDGTQRSLADVIAADPVAILGQRVLREHGPHLPFLLKLLAAGRPLSVQLHPSKEQAAAGFADEERRGVPADDPARMYSDASDKPELLVALGPFATMAGLRPLAAVRTLLAPLGADLAAALTGRGRTASTVDALGLLVEWPADRRAALVERAASVAAGRADPAAADDPATADPWTWVQRLAEQHPADPLVLAPLLLDVLVLQPGEGLYVPAGGVHGHLHGLGVEVMTTSDNVLRAGLTTKHVDAAAVLRAARSATSGPLRLPAPPPDATTASWPVPADTFALARCDAGADPQPLPPVDGPQVLLCTTGRAVVQGAGGRPVDVPAGEAVLVPAAAAPPLLSGPARVHRASVGAATA